MKSLLLLLVFSTLITLQFSCQKDKAASNVKSEFIIKHASGFSVHFQRNAASSNILDLSKEQSASALLQLVNRNFSRSKSEFITLMNFKLDLGDNYSYLIFEGYNKSTKSTSTFAYLIEFDSGAQKAVFKRSTVKNNDKLWSSGKLKDLRPEFDEILEANHSCTGSPCSCCGFVRHPNGVIYGCLCQGEFDPNCPQYPGQVCYHTATPSDIDGDGIDDEEDECPDQPGPISNMGCPIE